MENKYLLVIILFAIAVILEFFHKELIRGGLSEGSFLTIKRGLYLIAIGSLIVIFIKKRILGKK